MGVKVFSELICPSDKHAERLGVSECYQKRVRLFKYQQWIRDFPDTHAISS